MRKNKVVLVVAILVLVSSCQRRSTSPTVAATSQPIQPTTTKTDPQPAQTAAAIARPRVDACSLLTSSEITAIQNDNVKTTKLSGATDNGFDVSQCFFTLETFANSISLKVTQKRETNNARDPAEFWRTAFSQHEGNREDNRDRELAQKRASERSDREEKESVPPLPVTGIGDDAYWMGDQVGGALYVLKGDSYLRISIGGVGDRNAKIKKTTALAQKVLDRLNS